MREVPLETVLDILIDHRGKTPKKLGGDFTSSGVRVISAIHIKAGRINWEERYRFVSEDMYRRWMPEPTKRGDVLLTSEAPLGEVAQVTDDAPLVLSQRLFGLRGKACELDSTYLRYFLQSDLGRRRIVANESGSTVSGIRQALLRTVLIPLPPFREQQRIAQALRVFDELIETNRNTIVALEGLLHARFEQDAYDRAPNGAPCASLGELVDINPSLAKPRGEAPYVDMAMLPTKGALLPPPGTRPAQGGAKFTNGDTLLARITPCLENGKTAYVTNLEDGEVAVGSTEFVVLRGRERTAGIWPYCFARSPRFRAFAIQQLGDGTSGRQRLSADAVSNYRVSVPTEADLARFAAETAPLVEGMIRLHEEVLELSTQRDELLPLLMSGKVRVSELEGVG